MGGSVGKILGEPEFDTQNQHKKKIRHGDTC